MGDRSGGVARASDKGMMLASEKVSTPEKK